MNERRISAAEQIRVYLGKCWRLFQNENQWKNFLSAFIIILIISMVTGDDMFKDYSATNKGAFAIVSACIWCGLFNSIQSVCRERDIIKREYRTGLRISSYVLAHAIYEMAICAVESLIILLVVLVRNHSHLPDKGLVFPMVIDIYLTLFLVTYIADLIALLISCTVRTETTAMMVMPFVLVTQLVMCGVVFPLEGLTEKVSYLTVSRWGVNSIDAVARTNSTVDLQAIWFDAKGCDPESSTLLRAWGVLLLFCAVYIILCVIMLHRVKKDQR